VDHSRNLLEDQLSIYSSDLNVKKFFSEKGLKDRKQRVKFKCLTTKNKENKDDSEKSEAKSKSFFGNMTDYERCYSMMCLHNVKVAKILTKQRQLREDRQNGVIRIPSPTPPKPAKKKKAKKSKKGAQVDVTIKFKAEDGHVEEIVIKDAGKKKKKKAKAKEEEKEGRDDEETEADNTEENTLQALSNCA
jgi:hypothetical protein